MQRNNQKSLFSYPLTSELTGTWYLSTWSIISTPTETAQAAHGNDLEKRIKKSIHITRGCSFFIFYSPSSSPELLTNVFEVTSLLTPSLMAMAFTVAVFVRVMASLYRALALVGALPSVV